MVDEQGLQLQQHRQRRPCRCALHVRRLYGRRHRGQADHRIPACQRRRYGTFPGARGREERREPGFPCRQRRCQLYILQRAAACVVVLDIARDAARRRDALRLVLCSVHRHASAHHADAGARRRGGCHRLLRPQLPPKPSRTERSAIVPRAPYLVWLSLPRIIPPPKASFSLAYWWITARLAGT